MKTPFQGSTLPQHSIIQVEILDSCYKDKVNEVYFKLLIEPIHKRVTEININLMAEEEYHQTFLDHLSHFRNQQRALDSNFGKSFHQLFDFKGYL